MQLHRDLQPQLEQQGAQFFVITISGKPQGTELHRPPTMNYSAASQRRLGQKRQALGQGALGRAAEAAASVSVPAQSPP